IGADVDNLVFMKRTADKLFGDQYQWSVLAAGSAQMALATTAATLGGHVRVGLEDSLYISRGELAESNAQQVAKIRHLLETLGHEAAPPAEARAMLGRRGAGRVRICRRAGPRPWCSGRLAAALPHVGRDQMFRVPALQDGDDLVGALVGRGLQGFVRAARRV